MNFVVAPDLSSRRYVPRFRRVNEVQDANTLPVLGVLANGDINPVLVEDWRGVDFARPLSSRVLELLAVGRIAIIFPNGLEKTALALFYRLGIECVTKAIATPKQDLFLAVDFRQRWRAPLSMKNARPDFCVILAEQFAGLLVQRDKTRRVGRRDVRVRPV